MRYIVLKKNSNFTASYYFADVAGFVADYREIATAYCKVKKKKKNKHINTNP